MSKTSFKDLTGQVFNNLEVLHRTDNQRGKVTWHCKCKCGNFKDVAAHRLANGHTKSCGCLATNKIKALNKTHGMSGTPEWFAYWAAKRRCSPTNKEKRADYYDRGIKFLFTSFEEFYACVGSRPSSDYSLDREDNDGNYEVGNVKWATKSEQIRNQRCNNCVLLKARIAELEKQLKERSHNGKES
jgi:hypothetical protein